MLIDTQGNILQVWYRKDGVRIIDSDNQYGIEFSICVAYNDDRSEKWQRIRELKQELANTDYLSIKHSDGAISDEEFEPIKEQRAQWRAEINEIENSYVEPTLTREEIDEAERLAMEKLKETR